MGEGVTLGVTDALGGGAPIDLDGVFDGDADGGAPTDGLKDVDGVLLGLFDGEFEGVFEGVAEGGEPFEGVTDKQIVGLGVGLGVGLPGRPGEGGGEQSITDVITANQVPPVVCHSIPTAFFSLIKRYLLNFSPLPFLHPPASAPLNFPPK